MLLPQTTVFVPTGPQAPRLCQVPGALKGTGEIEASTSGSPPKSWSVGDIVHLFPSLRRSWTLGVSLWLYGAVPGVRIMVRQFSIFLLALKWLVLEPLNLFLNFSVYLCLNIHLSIYFSIYLKNLCYSLSLVVQLWSCVRLFVTHGLQHARLPCPSVSPGICLPLSWWCHLILCCPLLLLPSVLPSIRVFSSESAVRIRWPKYCSFSFSICPSSEYSGLISFRIGLISLQSKGLSRSSPIPQFKRINSLVLSFLYSPTLTSIHN